jgi:hypothetical protein
VVVLRKRDFLDLDNPLLAWMLDYDAVSAVLKALPAFKKLKQEQMEHIFDRCAVFQLYLVSPLKHMEAWRPWVVLEQLRVAKVCACRSRVVTRGLLQPQLRFAGHAVPCN